MTLQITKTLKISGGTLTLQDLRELVAACGPMKGESKLNITASHDPREGSYYTITVSE